VRRQLADRSREQYEEPSSRGGVIGAADVMTENSSAADWIISICWSGSSCRRRYGCASRAGDIQPAPLPLVRKAPPYW
jgi:hypothetical protein